LYIPLHNGCRGDADATMRMCGRPHIR